MRRNRHKFKYKASVLKVACDEKVKYHEGRLSFWKDEQKKAAAKAKDAGVEIREYEVTGGVNVDVVVDPSVVNRLNECKNKIRRHQEKIEEYTQEAAAYGSQPPGTLYTLDPEDVVHFGIKVVKQTNEG